MHVLYDARLLHRPLSGLERVQRNLLRELAGIPRIRRLRALVLDGPPLPKGLPAGVELVPVRGSEEILRLLLATDSRERPDVYHLSWFPDRHPRDLLLPVAAPASVVEVHDAILNRHPEYHPSEDAWAWYHDFVRQLVRSADRLLVHSRSVIGEIERDLGGDGARADVAPLAVDPALVEPLADGEVRRRLGALEVGDAPYVLAVGKDYPHKDHATLFRALARAPRELRLLCAGSRVWHVHGQSADDHCRKAGVKDRVRWIEGLDDVDVKALLQGAAALVYPSHEEGFGLPPLEAMALGTPVLASRAMSVPEVCGDGAWLFDAGDVDALSARLAEVVAGGAEVEALRRRGRERAAQFSWKRCAEATVDCYERAVAAAGKARPRLSPEVEALLRVVAASPVNESRELAAWQDRCHHVEAHARNLEAHRDQVVEQLQALQRETGRPVQAPPPPELGPLPSAATDPGPRWSLARRLRKIRSGLMRRLT